MPRLVITLLVALAAGCGSVSDSHGDMSANKDCVVGSSQIGSCLL